MPDQVQSLWHQCLTEPRGYMLLVEAVMEIALPLVHLVPLAPLTLHVMAPGHLEHVLHTFAGDAMVRDLELFVDTLTGATERVYLVKRSDVLWDAMAFASPDQLLRALRLKEGDHIRVCVSARAEWAVIDSFLWQDTSGEWEGMVHVMTIDGHVAPFSFAHRTSLLEVRERRGVGGSSD